MPGDVSVWKKILAKVHDLDRKHVKVGILGPMADEDSSAEGLTMGELGAVHEYGTADGRIPERSFIRSTLNDNNEELKKTIADLASKVVTNKMTADRALEILGTFSAAQVKKKITKTDIPPPLKPATIAAKGSSKPLVDTGALLNSISHQVDTDTDDGA